ncbi:MAG TPA: metalloregulator ArsR/SmtB family transcription factor [Symbiobacteriaceae bacterium]|nr:metalloregulator ArsR/SmtB family transcription factor [Symbiobacteriaceae bacterium]
MFEQEKLRQLMAFRFSPLLDLALSLLVLQNPERFGTSGAWVRRVLDRLPSGLLEQLRELGDRVDLFGLAIELETGASLPTPDLLRRYQEKDAAGGALLLTYWEAISPEVGARAGLLAESIHKAMAKLAETDPLTFICHYSDRVSVAGDGEAIILHWGKGMRVPLADLERILFVPSAFCPRRLMFYRLGPIQIFFYDPLYEEPRQIEEAPESLVLGFSALADANRLKLLRLIARETLPAQEMARQLDLNESTVSRHLRLLIEAGLVGRERQEGKFIYYSLQPERLDTLLQAVKAYLGRE